MGKLLQIPDVPDEVLAALKAKAEREGLSLAAYAVQPVAVRPLISATTAE
jgi:hypothetical protein